MDFSPLSEFDGYKSQTVGFKSTADGVINLDVAYPEEWDGGPATVLIHYHGGFLIVGDRYAFFPYWLVHACVSRKWIFVTPEYRLMPESTAHSAIEDASDAYKWVVSTLPSILDRSISSVLLAGSSAGAFLALSTAVAAIEKPAALLLIYGMLDPAASRYTTPGSNVFGRPVIDTRPVLEAYPKRTENDERQRISAHSLPANPTTDSRFGLISALHIDALFPDYMTGVDGLGRDIAAEGIAAIPREHEVIFPLTFGNLSGLPPTMLLHGENDSAVPVDCSKVAAEKLLSSGITVYKEFPDDAEHGFDARAGNVDVEKDKQSFKGADALRSAIRYLEDAAAT